MVSELDKRHTQLDFMKLRGFWDPRVPSESTTSQSITDRALPKTRKTQVPETADPKASHKSSDLVKSFQPPAAPLLVKQGSPWDYYEKMYQLRLGLDHRIIVVEERYPPAEELANVYSIRRFSDPDIISRQHLFGDIRHPNFVSAKQIFLHDSQCYVVFEHMPCSLHEVRDNELLTELRLASIVGQILNGLSYLAQRGLQHGSLSCSNIFLGYDGIVKIGEQEHCHQVPSRQAGRKDVRDLAAIVIDLISGDKKDDLFTFDRWSASHAIEFAEQSASAESTEDVSQHPLLQLAWEKVSLKGLANFGIAKARRGCGRV
ncbi:kinase-like domain-containing protein [Coniochaeta sp. 2T2.1]|nr:kinase-like domain-containing protein [Coniochaeta sp. 2T2.1]